VWALTIASVVKETPLLNSRRLSHGGVAITSSSSYMALEPISGLGLLLFMFLNLTLIDGW
jgi:hypothetical protein